MPKSPDYHRRREASALVPDTSESLEPPKDGQPGLERKGDIGRKPFLSDTKNQWHATPNPHRTCVECDRRSQSLSVQNCTHTGATHKRCLASEPPSTARHFTSCRRLRFQSVQDEFRFPQAGRNWFTTLQLRALTRCVPSGRLQPNCTRAGEPSLWRSA